MEETLCKAAITGDVEKLKQIIEADNLILEKIIVGSLKINPLNVAISRNQVEFVKFLLTQSKELAEVLDSGRTPLHLAAAKGNPDIVQALIEANPDMCLARDSDGRNPLHIAAMKGKLEVLEKLVSTDVQALIEAIPDMCLACDSDGRNPLHIAAMRGKLEILEKLVSTNPNAARVKLERNETILHLCVKHGQIKTLQWLLGMFIGFELINSTDSCGNTILHLAVSGRDFNIVKHVVNYDHHNGVYRRRIKLDVNAKNAEGHTAMDIVLLAQNKKYEDFLQLVKCRRAKDVVQHDWLTRKRDTLMVVASLIATMAFQAAVSPPAGVWQDDRDGHRAGEAVMAYNYPNSYPFFLRANTVSFVASLSMILLLISDMPFKNRLYMWILVVIMWLTITSTAITYAFSITVVTPKWARDSLSNTIIVGVIVWCSVMALLLVYHTLKLIKDSWDEYRSKKASNNNISLLHGCEKDQPNDESPSYAYTVPNLTASNDNRNQPHEIQMARTSETPQEIKD